VTDMTQTLALPAWSPINLSFNCLMEACLNAKKV